jgi:hypothetical protein
MTKYFNLIFLFVAVSSCSSLSNSIAPGYSEAFRTINNAVFGYKDTQITKEIIDNIPYASSLLKIGKGPQGLLILESLSGNKETWISADEVYLVIQNGRIIKTAGLNNNLIDFISPVKDFNGLDQDQVNRYFYSYDQPYLRNLEVSAELKIKTKEPVELLNKTLNLLLIEEEITNDYLGWNYTNRFWVDDQGEVIKSIQYISPRLPAFSLLVTKKPSR